MNSRSLTLSTWARITRTDAGPVDEADDEKQADHPALQFHIEPVPGQGAGMQMQGATVQYSRERDRQENRGQRHVHLRKAHQQQVQLPAAKSGDHSDDHPDQHCREHSRHPDRERNTGPVNHAPEHVAPEIVGAGEELPARLHRHAVLVQARRELLDGIVQQAGLDPERRGHRRQDQQGQHAAADEDEAVPENSPKPALRFRQGRCRALI